LDPSYKLHFILYSSFLAISNSILKAKLGLNTTQINPRFREASDANYEDDAPAADF
jgi:hypothetical protein